MKKPVAKQLPSGAWFCRVRIDGQDYSITRDRKELAEAEAFAIKTKIKEAQKKPDRKTLSVAIDDYIDARRNILSPSTIRGYKTIQSNRFQSMMNRNLFDVTPEQWQRAVNLEAREVSAKTLTNSWRFIASVIAETTGKRITVRLPQIIPAERPWLTPEQIPVFVDAVKGKNVEIAALLALSSLRRSEIVGLRWSDIDLEKGVLTVNGAAVPDENEKYVYKRETKNKTSRRVVPLIPPLKDALANAPRIGEYVIRCHPSSMINMVNRICKANDLPEVGMHGLRHSFASLAYYLNMPEQVAMEIGGWADIHTMRKIYTHVSGKSIRDAAQAFTNFFAPQKETPDSKNGNENDNEN